MQQHRTVHLGASPFILVLQGVQAPAPLVYPAAASSHFVDELITFVFLHRGAVYVSVGVAGRGAVVQWQH